MEHLDPAALASFQDGGLSPEERERATVHLADCAECRRRLAVQIRAAAGREAFGTGVVGAIERDRPASRGRTRELLAAAAIGALLLGGALWIALDREEPAGRASGPPAESVEPVPADRPAPGGHPSSDELAGTRSEEPPGTPAGRAPAAGQAADAPPTETDPGLLALRGARRSVEGRTFRLQGEDWVDTGWRPAAAGPPPVEVRRGSPAHRALIDRDPRVAAWSGVGSRVVVVVDSLAYRIVP